MRLALPKLSIVKVGGKIYATHSAYPARVGPSPTTVSAGYAPKEISELVDFTVDYNQIDEGPISGTKLCALT